jgi:hypothetical protein
MLGTDPNTAKVRVTLTDDEDNSSQFDFPPDVAESVAADMETIAAAIRQLPQP